MIIKKKLNIAEISWLTTMSGGGYVKCFYEPESVEEITELCRGFYSTGQTFDLIGHTSNTYFVPDYVCERMVSTRKLRNFEIRENEIYCECGTSVRQLSLAAIDAGIKGFTGSVDLPGTVASAIYGHATCYGTDISSMLLKATLLKSNGNVIDVDPEWFGFAKRSSVLKRREEHAVILSVILKRQNGRVDELKGLAEKNHAERRATQPEAKNSLGSIFANSGKATFLHKVLRHLLAPYAIILQLLGKNKKQIEEKCKHIIFALLGARDIEPYVRTWNWYQWKDDRAHELFWKYVRLHKKMFTRSEFEIEIKHNSNFKIP